MNRPTIRGTSGNDVWAGGGFDNLFHWDGTAWARHSTGTNNTWEDLHGTGPSDVWAVSGSGVVGQWDGGSWGLTTVASGVVMDGIWAAGPGDVWIVGSSGNIRHFTAGSWVTANALGSDLNDIWVSNWRGPEIFRYRP